VLWLLHHFLLVPCLNLLLRIREHATHALDVTFRNLLGRTQLALTLRLFLGKNVIEMGLSAFKATFARLTEALGRAPVGFHLRHYVVSTFIGLASFRN